MTSLVVRAHAKINLDLRIVARRADGCHELRTIFQSLALHDRLVFRTKRGAFEIESGDPDMPRDATNLVWRAAQALWSASGRAGEVRGVGVTIEKRIPSQAGLGGGSSDAAATFTALNELWRTRFGTGDLARLGASLGADVPYFLLGGTALGLGRGEMLYPLPDVPSMGVLLVKPSFGVSTAHAYGWYAAAPRRPSADVQALVVPWYPGPLAIANDLEAPVMQHCPELLAIRGALLRRRAEVAVMCGSGSAVCGLFPTVAEARMAAAGLRRSGQPGPSGTPRWQLIVTRFIGRRRYGNRLVADA
jgi:4-diphosphocytidyl-2-C-methyl-D-erythritol kinase